ncbi:MAG TPA: hypothetical protein VFO52_11885 [Longimicrobiales bacterium]|nr:hypothetical protein [Longimicrobiales bacterium]
MEYALDPHLPPRRREPRSRLERAGLTPRQERQFNVISSAIVVMFVIGWSWALFRTIRTGEVPPLLSGTVTANPLSRDAGPQTAYLLDAAMRAFSTEEFRGQSRAVRVIVQEPSDSLAVPDSLPAGAEVRVGASPTDTGTTAPSGPGVWNVLVAMRGAVRSVPDLNVLRLVPLSEKRAGRIGTYLVGSWPYEKGGRPRSPAYAPPRGLVRVTPENLDLQVSEHFRLRDFVTKGQQNVWPKYVAMSPRLLDKLELTIQELNASGVPVQHVGTISGFRTPQYNAEGGNTGGRGALSRHMYGDAMDWYVDNDRNGSMDDLNKDGRINKEDARVIGRAAERVEKKYPNLIGGIGLYNPTGAHNGFVHIDTRGYRARWGW